MPIIVLLVIAYLVWRYVRYHRGNLQQRVRLLEARMRLLEEQMDQGSRLPWITSRDPARGE